MFRGCYLTAAFMAVFARWFGLSRQMCNSLLDSSLLGQEGGGGEPSPSDVKPSILKQVRRKTHVWSGG